MDMLTPAGGTPIRANFLSLMGKFVKALALSDEQKRFELELGSG